MRHKLIKDVFTIINKGRQQIGFEVEGLDKYIFLSPGNIMQCTKVSINEVEILIGSKIRPELYTDGEEMTNGEIYKGKYPIIKDFWIECTGSVEHMRNQNQDKIKPLKEIQKVFQFHRNGKDNVGFDTGEEKATFISSNRLQKLTLLEPSEFHILEGSFINPEFYQEGEELHGGGTCFRSGALLKSLNLRYYGKIEEMHERFESSTNYHDEDNNNYDDNYDSNNWLADAAGSNEAEDMSVAYWNMD
jgi:hypothetical protein